MKHLVQSVTLATALAFGAGVANAQDIPIAVVGPIIGSKAASGEQMTRGAKMAVADINARGGVLGKRLDLLHSVLAAATELHSVAAKDGAKGSSRHGQIVLRGRLDH